MVRGMPLKDMHFRPTSRMVSAVGTGEDVDEAMEWRIVRDSGEFMVIVAAVYTLLSALHDMGARMEVLTAMTRYGCKLTPLDVASLSMDSYICRMFFGAGAVPARAQGALIAVFSAGDSRDMLF